MSSASIGMVAPPTLQATLDDWRVRSGAPGVSAAVRINGALHWSGSSGHGGRSLAAPRFPIYSITKTLTAVCVLRLYEAGELDVASAVTRWLPDLALPGSITLTHLLRHTSGIGDYGALREYHAAVRSRPAHPWTDQQFLDAVLPGGLLFAPGAGWAYSNVGYMLLRVVLQKVTGKSFARCVNDLVIAPLGLRDTFVAERINDWSSCVPGYGAEVDRNGKSVDVRQVYHPGWCAPGVAVSTPAETTQIFDELFTGKLLGSTALGMMLALVHVPGNHPPAVTPSSGMGILADPDSPLGASYGHGGGGPGYNVSVSVLPQTPRGRLTIAAFVNTSGGASARDAEGELTRRVLGYAA